MGRLIQIALDHLPIGPHRRQQGGRGRARRCEQGFDKAPGLFRIQTNLIVVLENLLRRFATMHDDERGHGTTLNRGRVLEKLSVRIRHAGDKPPVLWLFYNHLHVPNVRLCGTHCKG